MTDKSLDYEIENVGGIDHVHLQLQAGVNVLRGHNAAGKTSAMRAITRTQGGKAPIERRDGSSKGIVRGPGVSLTVRQVVKTTGEADLALADTGPLARLIDPGLKGTEAAARERIRALIELLDLRVDDESLELLAQKDEGLYDWLRKEAAEEGLEDLMEVAEHLRHQAHSRARHWETTGEQAEGQATAARQRCHELLEEIGGPDKLSKKTVNEARSALEGYTRRHERLLAQCEAREELEKKQESIRATLGPKPNVEKFQAEVLDLEKQAEDLQARITELSVQLSQLQTERGAVIRVLDQARQAASEKLTEAERWEKQKAILEQPLEGPTRDQVDELKTRFIDGAQLELNKATETAAYRAEQERKDEAIKEVDNARRMAEHYRELAASIPEVLGNILARAGAPGLTVIDGRLHAETEGQPKDFETRCSTGERVALALRVAATAYKGKVLPLDGALWTSLDPKNRAAFASLAEELGLYVITEEPTDGTLRIEHE